MLAKISALISSKVAIAALGGVLVVGGGATAAAVATGHVPSQVALLSHTTSNDASHDGKGTPGAGANGTHKVAIEGTLQTYASGASNTSTTSVQAVLLVGGKAEVADNGQSGQSDQNSQNDQSGDNTTGSSSSVQSNDGTTQGSTDPTATSTATSTTTTNGANTGSTSTCTLSSPFTVGVDANTKVNGQAKSASDLANDIGHKVQIQADEDSNCRLLATKVTVAAATPGAQGHAHVVVGTVQTVSGTSSFTLQTPHGSALTVNVSSDTTFHGAASSIADLKQGMHVGVVGTLSGTTIDASEVTAHGPGGSHGHGPGGQSGDVEGTIASVDSANDSFVVSGDGHQSVTVHVSASTTYGGDVAGFGDLKQGMNVVAEGTAQADGSLQASRVAAGDSGDGD